MELITLKAASTEFDVPRSTLNWWISEEYLPAEEEEPVPGFKIWKVKRADVMKLSQNRPKRGRPFKRA